jgi:hypothetical protein
MHAEVCASINPWLPADVNQSHICSGSHLLLLQLLQLVQSLRRRQGNGSAARETERVDGGGGRRAGGRESVLIKPESHIDRK